MSTDISHRVLSRTADIYGPTVATCSGHSANLYGYDDIYKDLETETLQNENSI